MTDYFLEVDGFDRFDLRHLGPDGSLNPGLQGHHGRRAPVAASDKPQLHDPIRHFYKLDIATIHLDGRSNPFNDLLHALTHQSLPVSA